MSTGPFRCRNRARAARTGAAIALLATAPFAAGCQGPPPDPQTAAARLRCAMASGDVALPDGVFTMGADPQGPEEGPPRRVRVAAFRIDRTEVTNAQFAAFVEATGYVTLAEKAPNPRDYPGVDPARLRPASLVFQGAQADPRLEDPSRWWRIVEGADWRHPTGPQSSIRGREQDPVVHIAHADAWAYARWRGRDLPTEAEWEYAARGGLDAARYVWGDAAPSASAPRANHWQGPFPAEDAGVDGYRAKVAPVGCFPPNGFGLYDMAGNVWEWTRDPASGGDAGAHLIKGGSFLCSDDFCFRYRPAARQAGPADTGASHIGFRTVARPPGAADQPRNGAPSAPGS